MSMPPWLVAYTGTDNFWWVKIFIVVFITLLLTLCVRVVLDRLFIKATETPSLWDDALLTSIKSPLIWLLWLIGTSWAADIAAIQSTSSLFDAVAIVRRVGVILLLSWFLVRFIRGAESNMLDVRYRTGPVDETTILAVAKLLRISVVISALLIVMQTLGYSISGVLAFGGIGGVAVGFAAKDLLANFFGGLMIYLDRPFLVGDWIRSPDKEIEGTVEQIGWRLTRIRTFDKRPLYVPNSTFAQIAVENASRMTNRRIKETIGIRYDDAGKMSAIVGRVEAYLRAHDAIDQAQTLMVNFNRFADSSLDFFIYTFTKTTDWVEFHKVKQEILLAIMAIIEDAGAQCAFPTSTLHVFTPDTHVAPFPSAPDQSLSLI